MEWTPINPSPAKWGLGYTWPHSWAGRFGGPATGRPASGNGFRFAVVRQTTMETSPCGPLANTHSPRDNYVYRAANGRAQEAVCTVVCLTTAGRIRNTGCGFTTDPPPEGPDPPLDPAFGRRNAIGDQSIGIHSNGMHTIPMEYMSNGMQ